MKIVSLSILSLFGTSAFAADCFGIAWPDFTEKVIGDAFWDARAKMCGNSDCPYQKDCTTQSIKRGAGLGDRDIVVSFSRKHTGKQKGFPECWVCLLASTLATNANMSLLGRDWVCLEVIDYQNVTNDRRQIINQCLRDQHKVIGSWENNGQLYQLNTRYS